jgi:hypothetical protein
MNNQELLELAAKACGWQVITRWEFDGLNVYVSGSGTRVKWNPLTDDGAALRLAVQLRLPISTDICFVEVSQDKQCEVTRHAIVHAAAEIGSNMA